MCHDYAGWFRKARKTDAGREEQPSDEALVKSPPQPVPPLKTHEPPTHVDEREKLPV